MAWRRWAPARISVQSSRGAAGSLNFDQSRERTVKMLASSENFSDYTPVSPEDDQTERRGSVFCLTELPTHIQLKIFSLFTPQEICSLVAPVCGFWAKLAFSSSLWKSVSISLNTLDHSWEMKKVLTKVSQTVESLSFYVKENLSCEAVIAAETIPFLPALKILDMGFNKGLELAVVDFLVDQCPNVTSANFEGSKEIDDRCLEVIAIGWNDLEELNISHCTSVTDEGVSLIANRVSRLKMLNIDGISFITDNAILELVKLRKNSLERVYLDGEELTELSVFSLSHCPKLKLLSISFCETLTDNALVYLKDLSVIIEHLHLRKGLDLRAEAFIKVFRSGFWSLRFLNLAECEGLNDSVVDSLTTCCTALESLSIAWCWSVTDKGLELIVQRLGGLRLLGLVGLDLISGAAFATVPQMNLSKLQLLDLRQCNFISDDVIDELVKRKKGLTVLNYYGDVLDDTSVWAEPVHRAFWSQREAVRKSSLRKFQGGCCMFTM